VIGQELVFPTWHGHWQLFEHKLLKTLKCGFQKHVVLF